MADKQIEQMLMAMVGALTPEGEPSGFMSQGMCIPLAATPKLLEIVEALGEDAVADWLTDNEVPGPKAGGLWVIECILENEEADAYDIEIPSWKWRQPTIDEIKALQIRAIWRAERYRVPPMEAPRDWVYVGALV
jgi:hypothetical protein